MKCSLMISISSTTPAFYLIYLAFQYRKSNQAKTYQAYLWLVLPLHNSFYEILCDEMIDFLCDTCESQIGIWNSHDDECERRDVKLIFYEKNLKPANGPKSFHDPALMFQANSHQNIGLDNADFWVSSELLGYSYKNELQFV